MNQSEETRILKKLSSAVLLGMLIFSISSFSYAYESLVVVVSCAGDVKVFPDSEGEGLTCIPEMSLEGGTRVLTQEESYVEIAFDNNKENRVKIQENSDVVIKVSGDDRIELLDGEIFVMLKALKKGEAFRIKTPCATCGARGTVWHIRTDSSVTDVSVLDGIISVRGIGEDGLVMEQEHAVKAGYETRIERLKQPEEAVKISKSKYLKLINQTKSPGMVIKKELNEGVSEIDLERMEDRVSRSEQVMDSLENRLERFRSFDSMPGPGGGGIVSPPAGSPPPGDDD